MTSVRENDRFNPLSTPGDMDFISPLSVPEKANTICSETYSDTNYNCSIQKSATLKPPYYPPTSGMEGTNLVQRHQALMSRVNDKNSTQKLTKNRTEEKLPTQSGPSGGYKSPHRRLQSKADLNNPNIFSDQKPPARSKNQGEGNKALQKRRKQPKKQKEKSINKHNIIQLKTKHIRNVSSIDGKSSNRRKRPKVLSARPTSAAHMPLSNKMTEDVPKEKVQRKKIKLDNDKENRPPREQIRKQQELTKKPEDLVFEKE